MSTVYYCDEPVFNPDGSVERSVRMSYTRARLLRDWKPYWQSQMLKKGGSIDLYTDKEILEDWKTVNGGWEERE